MTSASAGRRPILTFAARPTVAGQPRIVTSDWDTVAAG